MSSVADRIIAPTRALTVGDARRWWGRSWFAVSGVLLIAACEYKWRIRPAGDSLGGQIDLAVLAEIGAYGLVAAYLLQYRSPVPRIGRTAPAMAWLIAYAGYAALAAAWSPYRLTGVVRAVETVVTLWLVWTAARGADRALFHRFAHLFIVLTSLSVVVGVVAPFPVVGDIQEGRFTWLMVHPTTAAVFLGISIILAVIYLVERRADTAGVGWSAWGYWLSLAVNVFALYSNHTRGVIIGVVVGLVLLASLIHPVRRRVAGLAILAWLAAVVPLVAANVIVTYVERGEDASKLATLNERTSLWTTALTAVQKEPLYGYGLYASRGIFVDETGLGGGHNALINVAVDLGAVGVALWAGLLVTIAIAGWRMRGHIGGFEFPSIDRLIILSLLAFFFVDGVSIAGLGGLANVSSIWLFVLVGWVRVSARAHRHLSTPASVVVGAVERT